MTHRVLLAKTSKSKTAVELFPDGSRVFSDWTQELADRVLPVAAFDGTLVNDQPGLCVFLYYEDTGIDFLEWQTDGQVITMVTEWHEIKPFIEKPAVEKIINKLGGAYLSFDTFEIESNVPSAYLPKKWAEIFEEKMVDAGAFSIFDRLRLGGGYPCYVQGEQPLDGPGFIAELPASYYELAPMDFYLFRFGNEFQQMMQMT